MLINKIIHYRETLKFLAGILSTTKDLLDNRRFKAQLGIASFIILFINTAFAVFPQTPNLQSQITAGENLAQTCVACHGEKGQSNNPAWPNLAGQNSKYFIAQMQAFRAGSKGGRDNAIMYPLAKDLTDQQITELAAYYAAQNPVFSQAKNLNIELGEQIYRGGILADGIPACASCHNPRGRGNKEAGFPLLAGQHTAYTLQQLVDYKNGKRTTGINGMMISIAQKLSQQQMEAVANYIQGLR